MAPYSLGLTNLYPAGISADLSADDATSFSASAKERPAISLLNTSARQAASTISWFMRWPISLTTANVARSDCVRPGGVSDCWRSSSPSAKPLLMPARPTAAFANSARSCGLGRYRLFS